MKIKALVVLFNGALLLLCMGTGYVLFLTPVRGTGWQSVRAYGIFFLIFLLLFLLINTLYVKNRRLLRYLDAEDWSALAALLEEEVFTRNRVALRRVSLLSESLILLSDFEALERLEHFVHAQRPRYIMKCALTFAVGKLLVGKYSELRTFMTRVAATQAPVQPWTRFYLAFACHLCGDFEQAHAHLLTLVHTKRQPLIRVLSAYLLSEVLPEKLRRAPAHDAQLIARGCAHAAQVRADVHAHYTPRRWADYENRKKQNVDVLVFLKLMQDARAWLFP